MKLPDDGRRGEGLTAGSRAARRVPGAEVAMGGEVRLSPGGAVELINISQGGALVETSARLVVGAVVTLSVGGPRPQRLRGRIVRSQVCAIHRDSTMSYQLGIAFEDQAQVDAVPDDKVDREAVATAATQETSWPADVKEQEATSPINEW